MFRKRPKLTYNPHDRTKIRYTFDGRYIRRVRRNSRSVPGYITRDIYIFDESGASNVASDIVFAHARSVLIIKRRDGDNR